MDYQVLAEVAFDVRGGPAHRPDPGRAFPPTTSPDAAAPTTWQELSCLPAPLQMALAP